MRIVRRVDRRHRQGPALRLARRRGVGTKVTSRTSGRPSGATPPKLFACTCTIEKRAWSLRIESANRARDRCVSWNSMTMPTTRSAWRRIASMIRYSQPSMSIFRKTLRESVRANTLSSVTSWCWSMRSWMRSRKWFASPVKNAS
jgi:hypothetical protein